MPIFSQYIIILLGVVVDKRSNATQQLHGQEQHRQQCETTTITMQNNTKQHKTTRNNTKQLETTRNNAKQQYTVIATRRGGR